MYVLVHTVLMGEIIIVVDNAFFIERKTVFMIVHSRCTCALHFAYVCFIWLVGCLLL